VSESAELLATQPTPPEELDLFRLGRLLLLISEVAGLKRPQPLDIDRLGIYDFFAANPFLIFPADSPAGLRLTLAGFNSRSLGYQSSFHRFATRRERLRADLARLVGLNLVQSVVAKGRVAFVVSESGVETSERFVGLYAQGYREAAAAIATALNRLSDTKLRAQVGDWLQAESFLIDLFDEGAVA
jgi:hypothetical protein